MSILKANRIENLTTTDGGINVNNSGNVKIGTGSDRYDELTASTANLQVDGGIVFEPGSGNDAEIINYRGTPMVFGTSGSERLRIDGSGRLLVGASSAETAYPFSVAPSLQVESTNYVKSAISIFNNQNSDAGAQFVLGKSRGTSNGSDTVVQDDDFLGTIYFVGADGTDRNSYGASIAAAVDGTPGSNDMPGSLRFSTTADGASSPTERMRIDSSGNVGIGTTSPDEDLHVYSSSGAIKIDSSGDAALRFATSGTNKFSIFHSGGTLRFFDNSNSSERMRLDSSGRLGINTTSLVSKFTIDNGGRADPSSTGSTTQSNSALEINADSESNTRLMAGMSTGSKFWMQVQNTSANGTDDILLNPIGGNVGIGTTSPHSYYAKHLVVDTGSASQSGITIVSDSSNQGMFAFADGTSGADRYRGFLDYNHSNNSLAFGTNGSERARLGNDGFLGLQGATATGGVSSGKKFYISSAGSIYNAVESDIVLYVNRTGTDGTLIELRHQNSAEGTISVSGSTVSYNGGHLTRWSQLAGGAERIEILRGSVLSNLDEMCEWAYEAQDAVLYTEEDELPEGVSVGDVKISAVAAGTEDNEQLNRMKVSDVEGDPNVSGVFQGWDDDDDTYDNDFYCAMTGDFVIRIAQGTTVARGDLLMSAGDGTAKPQDDDIVRSKTIAKVTSTTVSTTYSDGSYCVPCVLMAC